jgi:hypothetical protein
MDMRSIDFEKEVGVKLVGGINFKGRKVRKIVKMES